MFKLSVKLSKDNEKLEKIIVEFKEYIEFLENKNKVLGEEIYNIIDQSLK